MSSGIWELATLATKVLTLLAAAGVIGGCFTLMLARRHGFAVLFLLRYLLGCSLLGLLATSLFFLVQVGAVNRSGIGGMFDPLLGGILLQSGLGWVAGLRLLAFAALPLQLWLLQDEGGSGQFRPRCGRVLHVLVPLVLCGSFVFTGHTTVLPMSARVALVLHVLAGFLWLGSLYPLQKLCCESRHDNVRQLMRDFGRLALGIVAILLVAGTYMAMQLLGSPAELAGTAYGRTFLVKIGAVVLLLTFAALNKLVLVPRLHTAAASLALQRSISMELLLAACVLVVTGILTTTTGPAAQ